MIGAVSMIDARDVISLHVERDIEIRTAINGPGERMSIRSKGKVLPAFSSRLEPLVGWRLIEKSIGGKHDCGCRRLRHGGNDRERMGDTRERRATA